MQERLKRLQGEVDALELRNLRLMEKLCREQREDLERTRLPLAAVYHHISTEKCDLGMRPQAFALASSQTFTLGPLTCNVCAFHTMNNKNYRNRLMNRGLGSKSF